ncbi:MAG: GEGP motif-containing diheme protein [Thermodesulfobacteriota bacterium]
MKMRTTFLLMTALIALLAATNGMAAYHHEGENDSSNFLGAYPGKAGTKLDQCVLCHKGGSYEGSKGTVTLGSCQWCHYSYGYDGSGNITDTLNAYGMAYFTGGRDAEAVTNIEGLDSDGDTFTNIAEINANRYPGDATDDPSKITAPFRVYTRAQLEALSQHTQFLLMNASRSQDNYVQYTGVPMKDLLDDAGILPSATGIWVYAPDGWSQSHPLEFDAALEMYHVYGNMPGQAYQYPPSTYFYNIEADADTNPDYGWCDYSAPSCVGRAHGDNITVAGGLKAILALKREGANLDPGVLNDENKLDGEGPFRVVVPQKYPSAPDQSSRSDQQEVVWPYVEDWDHNAGACSRSATIIKVEPLPEGTTDIDILEAGWNYVDQEKIVIYGAIDGDSNGNGLVDSEEGTGSDDYDGDGILDYQDTDTAKPNSATGQGQVILHTSAGAFAAVAAMNDDDADLTQTGKPNQEFPYGVFDFQVTGLAPGGSVVITIVFPDAVVQSARIYKITAAGGWVQMPFSSNDGDETITVTLTDGDPATDADGAADGTIHDPFALGEKAGGSSGGSSGGTCFIDTITAE